MLPRAVQAQVDAAEKLYEQMNTQSAEGNPGELPAAVNADSQPAAEPKPQVQAEFQESKDAGYWKHRFDVLQGKYNAEVPALRRENSELTSKVERLEKQIESAAGAGSAVDRAQSAVNNLTPQEIEEFGPDLVNLIQRVAGNGAGEQESLKNIQGKLDMLEKEREQERQSAHEQSRKQAEESFLTGLAKQVPNWQEINADQNFLTWLDGTEPVTGERWQSLLDKASGDFDYYRVAHIFTSFAGKQAPKSRIPDDIVQPSQSRAGNAEPVPGRIWTNADIGKFFKEIGKYSREEAAAIEKDIFAASSEGRVRG
jgi:hypothetical protein